jgi:hypothetical protein
MANWYYHDQTGKKCGPVDSGTLKTLAIHGIITPETMILTEDGRESLAGKIKGLEFPQTRLTSTSVPIPPPVESYSVSVPVPVATNSTPPPMEDSLGRLTGGRITEVYEKAEKPQIDRGFGELSGEFPIVIYVYTLFIGFDLAYKSAVRLEIYKNKITVKRLGIGNLAVHGLKGAKTLHYSKISALQFLRSSFGFFDGYLQFTISGGNESRGGIFAAVYDENSIMFSSRHNEIVQVLHDFIETRMEEEDSTEVLRDLREQSLNHTRLPLDGCLVMLFLMIPFIVGFVFYLLSMM